MTLAPGMGCFPLTTTQPFHQQHAIMEGGSVCAEPDAVSPARAGLTLPALLGGAVLWIPNRDVLAELCAFFLLPWDVSWWPEVVDGSL